MVGRWLTLGLLGWLNLAESQADAGVPMTDADLRNLASCHRRIGALLTRYGVETTDGAGVTPVARASIDVPPLDAPTVSVPLGAAGRRRRAQNGKGGE